jgi:hypothetical protein
MIAMVFVSRDDNRDVVRFLQPVEGSANCERREEKRRGVTGEK